ncbi:MAG: HNH endonuclease signature motif containing protein [Bacteroidota bacterium]
MPKRYISSEIKKIIKERAKGCCEYCLAISAFAFHPFAIDHIIPVVKGGNNNSDNLAYICQHCNNSKYDKIEAVDPISKKMVDLFNPRTEDWTEHFTWSEDYQYILGLTAIGRATVSCLKVNRQEAINLRAALYAYGVHPPF